MQAPLATAEAVSARYAAAVLAQDAEALADLYAPDVVVFDAWAVWRYNGLPAWRPVLQGWLGGLGDQRVVVAFDDLQARGAGDLVIVSAIVRYADISPAGETLKAMENRLSWAIGADGRIVHEHTSSPLVPDTGKGLLNRALP